MIYPFKIKRNVGCLGEGEFTPLIPLFPLPQTGKRNLKIFKTSFLSENKRKGIHQLTAYIWLRLLYKSLHPYFAPLRYAKHQIYANVDQNVAPLHFDQCARVPRSLPRSLRDTSANYEYPPLRSISESENFIFIFRNVGYSRALCDMPAH